MKATLYVLLLGFAAPLVVSEAHARGVQLTPDGKRTLVNKDVGNERWAITLHDDGSVTGNVFRRDTNSAAFIACTPRAPGRLVCVGSEGCSENAGQRGVRRTPDGERVLVSKDVGAERWAIGLNGDGTLTGNVFFRNERPPAFIHCVPRPGANKFACSGATACVTDTCDDYNPLMEVQLPVEFFREGTGCAAYVPLGEVTLPPVFFVPDRPTLQVSSVAPALGNGVVEVPFSLSIDTGISSAMIIADTTGTVSGVSALAFPSGPIVLDSDGFDSVTPRLLRTMPPGEVNVLGIPNTPVLPFEHGEYRATATLVNDGTAALNVTTILNRRVQSGAGHIDLRLMFIAIPGVSAHDAPSRPEIAALLDAYDRILATSGIRLGRVSFHDVPADKALSLTVVDLDRDDDSNGQADQIDELLSLPRPTGGRTLDVFFIQQFLPNDVVGLAGGIPGPALVPPNARAGVVVAAHDGFSGISRETTALAHALVHETGHFLGLFHTSEGHPLLVGSTDPLPDTPPCDASAISTDPILCPDAANVMFFTLIDSGVGSPTFTSDQAFVMQRHPLIRD